MTRTRRAVLVLLLPVVLVPVGCSAAGAAADPADLTAIAARSEPLGIAPELVHVTEVDGFELATQSVGVMGDDGMSAVYVGSGSGAAGTVMLATSRRPSPDVVPCADLPDSSEPVLRCAVEHGDVHVLLEGTDVDAATLRAAAEAVRVPGGAELDRLFADVPTPEPPVERGDLPPDGDGAPLDPSGAGG